MPDEGTTALGRRRPAGRIEFPNEELEDLVLVRSDGRPTYNFASPRRGLAGRDHARDPRRRPHLEHAEADPDPARARRGDPVYAHVPNVNGADGKKLSKRHGAVSVDEFRAGRLRARGARQLPRPARLGTGRRDDDHVARRARRALLARARGASAATFDYDKLDWMNGVYLRELSAGRVRRPPRRVLREQGYDWDEERVRAAAPLVQEKIAHARRVPRVRRLPLPRRRARPGAARPRTCSPRRPRRSRTSSRSTAEPIEAALKELCERLGLKPRQAFQPIRVAVTGSKVSPGLYESLELLGQGRVARAAQPRRGRRSGLGGASGSSARWNSSHARRR